MFRWACSLPLEVEGDALQISNGILLFGWYSAGIANGDKTSLSLSQSINEKKLKPVSKKKEFYNWLHTHCLLASFLDQGQSAVIVGQWFGGSKAHDSTINLISNIRPKLGNISNIMSKAIAVEPCQMLIMVKGIEQSIRLKWAATCQILAHLNAEVTQS